MQSIYIETLSHSEHASAIISSDSSKNSPMKIMQRSPQFLNPVSSISSRPRCCRSRHSSCSSTEANSRLNTCRNSPSDHPTSEQARTPPGIDHQMVSCKTHCKIESHISGGCMQLRDPSKCRQQLLPKTDSMHIPLPLPVLK